MAPPTTHGSPQWKNAGRRVAIITEQILHRSRSKQGALAAPFFFPAMSATLNRARIGESRSKLRAFDGGSPALLPVFSLSIFCWQETSREHRRHPGN
jgi:hypothetical protein